VADHFTSSSLAGVYAPLCHHLTTSGYEVSPRGRLTREILDTTVTINDPTDVVLPPSSGRVAYRPVIGIAEGLLLIAGVSDPPLMARISPAFHQFTDGGAFHGAYGPRLRYQLPRAISRLVNDPDTRQAVVTIWDPLHDGAEPAQESPADLPCTVYLNFRVRHGQLSLKVHMRSNDLWLGFPYDVFQFTLLQKTVAEVLSLKLGSYVHHVDSMHIYEQHWNVANKVEFVPGETRPVVKGLGATTWQHARQFATELLYEEVVWTPGTTCQYLDKMISSYRS
jgi:thymidylate synthase